jgi:prevent-host-death family protein
MSRKFVNIHDAKTRLSQLVARVELGERITIARDGKPVAQLVPAPRASRNTLPSDDPLLNLEEFAIEGSGGSLTNTDIDQILYGKP